MNVKEKMISEIYEKYHVEQKSGKMINRLQRDIEEYEVERMAKEHPFDRWFHIFAEGSKHLFIPILIFMIFGMVYIALAVFVSNIILFIVSVLIVESRGYYQPERIKRFDVVKEFYDKKWGEWKHENLPHMGK